MVKLPPEMNELYLNWARQYILAIPTIFDKNRLWWQWNFQDNQFQGVDETDLLNGMRKAHNLGDHAIQHAKEIIEALRLEARDNILPELPDNMIQFGSKLYDINSGSTMNVLDDNEQPRYFTTNAIPWELGDSDSTPTIDRLFTEWTGQQGAIALYEILAYCCYRKYPLHIVVALHGSGRNGKGTYLRVLEKLIGKKNIASTDFERLVANPRFETFNMYRKLACVMGETNYSKLKNTSLLKRLSGDDLIAYEKKGSSQFDDHNYATLIIATNSLPRTDDETDGFYSRWIIVDFPNRFPEGKDVAEQITDDEIRNLARKITHVLPKLLEQRSITGAGSIEQRKARYIEVSNPFPRFVAERCVTDDADEYIRYRRLLQAYNAYLREHKRRTIKRKEFSEILDDENFEVHQTTKRNELGEYEKDTYVYGIRLKELIFEFEQEKGYIHNTRDTRHTSTQPPTYRSEWEKSDIACMTDIGRKKAEFENEDLVVTTEDFCYDK